MTFTLIELLVVVTIIMILAAVLLPALSQARYTAKTIVCVNQLKEITLAWTAYAGDSDNYYPDYGDEDHPDYLAALADDQRTRRKSTRYRPYSWADNDSRYPYLNGDLRPMVSPYLGNLDDIVHCELSIPYFKKNHVFERKDADGNYILSGYPGQNESSPKTSYWIYPDSNYFRFGWGASTDPREGRRKTMRKLGQSFQPGQKNPAGLRWDVVISDCIGWAGTYGNRSLFGPVSSHPSRLGGSVENGSYADFFWWDWNTPVYAPVTGSFSRADGSVTYYPSVKPYDVTIQGTSSPGWQMYWTNNRGAFLPKDLAIEE